MNDNRETTDFDCYFLWGNEKRRLGENIKNSMRLTVIFYRKMQNKQEFVV